MCGWHPGEGSEKEIFTLEELIQEFDLNRVQKSGAICDLQKAKWYNGQYLHNLPKERLLNLIKKVLPKNWKSEDDKNLDKKIQTVKDRIMLIGEAPEALKFYYEWEVPSAEILIHKKFCPEISDVKEILTNYLSFLETLEDFSEKNIEEKSIQWIKENDYKNGQVLWPYRVAITGQKNSPGPFEVSEALGKEECFKRMKMVLEKI